MMPNLTPQQARALREIRRFLLDRGYPPTQAEIGKALGQHSKNASNELIGRLIRKGALRRERYVARGIAITGQGQLWLDTHPEPQSAAKPAALLRLA
jgi:repressor LexA